MPTPDLTLAICMYNAVPYITETLQSILAQTMQSFHLLILDDCSTDDSVACVEQFFETHPHQYELLRHDSNKGLAAMRYRAEHYAQTKYMMFVDADDLPKPYLVETLYNRISTDNDLMAVGCYLSYIDEAGHKLTGGLFLGETTKEGFYKKAEKGKLIFMQSTAIYNRELAIAVGGHNIKGFPEGFPRYQDYCEDLDFWTRMSDLYTTNKAIIVVPKVLCFYRKHTQGLSSNSFPMLLRMRHVKTNLKRRRRGEKELSFVDFQAQYPIKDYERLKREAKAADNLRMGYHSLRQGQVLRGLGKLVSSLWYSPGYMLDKFKHNVLRKR